MIDVMIKYFVRSRIFLLSASVIGGHLYGQQVIFTAEATATKVGLKDKIQVQFVIRDVPNLQTISAPVTPDFKIVAGPYQQQSINKMVAGDKMVQSMAVTLTYILQPKYEGNFTIPPLVAKDASGHTYQSNPLTIQVQGTSPQVSHTSH